MKLAERLSEPKASCSLPISAFSIVPNFLVLLASWSGAEASRTHDLNTSSTSPLHCFRSICPSSNSPANPDLQYEGRRSVCACCHFLIQKVQALRIGPEQLHFLNEIICICLFFALFFDEPVKELHGAEIF